MLGTTRSFLRTFLPFFFILITDTGFSIIPDDFLRQLNHSKGRERIKILNEISFLNMTDSVAKSEKYAREALKLSLISADKSLEAESDIRLARALISQDKFSESEPYIKRAFNIRREMGDSAGLVPVYRALAAYYYIQSNYIKGMEILRHAQSLALNLGLPEDPYFLKEVGYVNSCLGNRATAEEYYRQALRLLQEKKDEANQVGIYIFLGIRYGDLGQYDKSIEYYYQAMAIQVRENDSIAYAYTLVNLGSAFALHLGKEKALQSYEMALNIFKRKKIARGIAYVRNAMGTIYWNEKDTWNAIPAYEDAVKYYSAIGHSEGVAFAMGNLGEIYIYLKNYPKAQEYLFRSLHLADSIGSKIGQCTTLSTLGKLYRQTGKSGKSWDCFHRSLSMAQEIGYRHVLMDDYLSLSELSYQRGDYRTAFDYNKLYNTIKDSVFMEKNQKIIAEMEERFNSDLKEKKIALLVNDNEIKDIQLIENRRFTIFWISATLILFILALLIFRFYLQKRKAYQDLVRISLRNIQEEPVMPDLSPMNDLQVSEEILAIEKNEKKSLPDETLQRIIRNLEQHVITEKAFLDPDLSLADMAHKLNTNTTYLSKAINEQLQTNFNSFINELRIREAERLLANPAYSNRSIDGIARMAGFNSKSAFNQAFKRFTGVTPSFFQHSALNMDS